MPWQECKLTSHTIINAYFGLALGHRPKLFIIYLIIVLTAATVASISSNYKLWLDFSCTDHDCFTYDQ